MREKYIDLLLNKCTDLSKSKILFIHYRKESKDFVDELVIKAREFGFEEFYLNENDPYKTHEILLNSTLEEIEKSDYFDESIWDEYAKRYASFLMLDTEYPGLMADIDPKKIGLSTKRRRQTRPIYRKMAQNGEISWCIAAYPGEVWAKELFPGDEAAYQKLEDAIYKMCMIDRDNPLASWDEHLEKVNKIIDVLNGLDLEKLHYSNSLGTNLDVYLPKGYLFASAKDNNVIVNMPSYEVFASPIYNKTEGIVYSSMPLIYGGALIDKFFIKFSEGRVVDFDAKVGKEVLKEIIEADSNSCYLGECALVEKTSPINKMNLVFGSTLIDENASCHFALGDSFPECVRDGIGLEDADLLKLGLNVSKTHVDFMIGTADLDIVGTTRSGEEIFIFKAGVFNPELMS